MEITNPRQAQLLTNPRSAGFIYPFLARERSTSQAAAETGCPLSTMAYRVKVLREAGLLVVARTESRAGRQINYYRSTADSYHVPFLATGFDDLRDQASRIGAPIYRQITEAYAAVLTQADAATRFITRDDHGGIYTTDLPPNRTLQGFPLTFEDRVMYLTREQADRLCATLETTLASIAEPAHSDQSQREPYLIMLCALPTQRT